MSKLLTKRPRLASLIGTAAGCLMFCIGLGTVVGTGPALMAGGALLAFGAFKTDVEGLMNE